MLLFTENFYTDIIPFRNCGGLMVFVCVRLDQKVIVQIPRFLEQDTLTLYTCSTD